MAESELRAERLKKLNLLKDAGMEPYPSDSHRDCAIRDALRDFENLEKSQKKIHLAGRLLGKRGQGGILFVDLFDGTERMQVVLQKSEMDESQFRLFEDAVDIGDFVDVSGTVFKTKSGERSLKAKKWRMLAKSLLPIPAQWYGVKDEETRLRQRYLDILLDRDLRALFERRAKFWHAIRGFYLQKGFLEVETPVLETSPGGADARPFKTHHNALDIDVYLRISAGELWQKELLIAGFPKVFEIGRIFRNEGQSREHLQDYTQVESYEAYSDMHKGMKFVQELYRHIVKEVYGQYSFKIAEHDVDFAADWPIADFSQKLRDEFGVYPATCSEDAAIEAVRKAGLTFSDAPNKIRALDLLWKQIRKTISGPVFLIGIPVELEPLAKKSPSNPDQVERIQIILAGSEVGKGYSELNDPLDQATRFAQQQKLREAGDEEAQRFDKDFVRAMEYGMPPAFGFGVSERLFALLENKPIHETQLFPLLRPRQE